MLNRQKTIERYKTLINNAAEVDRIITWLGRRVFAEIQHLMFQSNIYSRYLQQIVEKESDRRTWGLIIAAAEYRKKKPHDAKLLATIDEQRRAREKENPYRGMTVSQRILTDYDKITTYRAAGWKWAQIASELRKQRKYRGLKFSPDLLRKVTKEEETRRATYLQGADTSPAADATEPPEAAPSQTSQIEPKPSDNEKEAHAEAWAPSQEEPLADTDFL